MYDKTAEIFRFIRTVSDVLALPTFRIIHKSPTIHAKYAAFVEMLNISMVIRMFARFWIEPFSVATLIETTCTVGYVLVENFRFFTLYKNRKIIDGYLMDIEKINYLSDKFLLIFEKNDKFKRKVGKIIFSFQVGMAIGVYLLGPFVLPPEYVTIPASYPWKDYGPSVMILYRCLDFIVVLYLPARITAIDLTCLTFITFHVSQQEFLKGELKNILKGIEKGKNRDKELREWYRRHQESLRLVNDLKKFLEPIILINYAYSLVCTVTAIFFIIEESSMQMTQKLNAFGSFFAFFAFLGWFCNYVDQLNHQHETIPDQFDLQYAAQNKRLKNDFLILAPRSSRKIKISAMGFFTMSSKEFSGIISASLSLLTTFWQIRNKALT